MKILASSPYAIFNAKEWQSPSRNYQIACSNDLVKIKKKFYTSFKRYESSELSQAKKANPKIIQLSFA